MEEKSRRVVNDPYEEELPKQMNTVKRYQHASKR